MDNFWSQETTNLQAQYDEIFKSYRTSVLRDVKKRLSEILGDKHQIVEIKIYWENAWNDDGYSDYLIYELNGNARDMPDEFDGDMEELIEQLKEIHNSQSIFTSGTSISFVEE